MSVEGDNTLELIIINTPRSNSFLVIRVDESSFNKLECGCGGK